MARVESVDKVDRATLAVDCTEADFRNFETALYQVLHRTTANEPLRMIQQVEGQRGFEAWHLVVRRYDQRNTSDRSSAYAALISNITERDRAKDVEQFDDILRTFTIEMTKFENRFGKIRDEEKVLAVKIGMATKEDGENASQEGDQRIVDLALQAVYKGTGKGKWGFGKGQSWNEKGSKGSKGGGKNSWQKGSGKKGGKGQEKGGKGETRTCWTWGKTGHIAAWCRKGSNKNLYAVDEDDSENVEESAEDEDDLQAWCLLEESENEQWQEVISRRNKQRVKRANQASLLSVVKF